MKPTEEKWHWVLEQCGFTEVHYKCNLDTVDFEPVLEVP